MEGQNRATAIALSPIAVGGLINSLTAAAETTGAPNEAKHSWARTTTLGLLSLATAAAPIAEAANPAYAAAIDAAIKGSVALYNMYGWPHEQPPAPQVVVPTPIVMTTDAPPLPGTYTAADAIPPSPSA